MKIHVTIEFDDARAPRSVRINGVEAVGPVAESPSAPPRTRGRPRKTHVEIAPVAPPPIPPQPAPDAPACKPGSGPQFDPGFVKIIQDAHEPFTRRSIAIESGLDVIEVTQRFNRMKHKGWLEQPAPNLWRRTKTFGQKPLNHETH